MRKIRTALIAAVASATLAGAALAAHDQDRMMLVALPDGSVSHIRYDAAAAPQLMLVRIPTSATFFDAAFGPASPFAEMARISAAMEAQAAAMMRQAAMLQAQAPATGGKGVVLTNDTGQPVGVMHYSYVSSTTGPDGCTRTVRIRSNGSDEQPNVIRTSAGNCNAAKAAPAPRVASTTRPAPKITPVSAPRPLPDFTPSPTI